MTLRHNIEEAWPLMNITQRGVAWLHLSLLWGTACACNAVHSQISRAEASLAAQRWILWKHRVTDAYFFWNNWGNVTTECMILHVLFITFVQLLVGYVSLRIICSSNVCGACWDLYTQVKVTGNECQKCP